MAVGWTEQSRCDCPNLSQGHAITRQKAEHVQNWSSAAGAHSMTLALLFTPVHPAMPYSSGVFAACLAPGCVHKAWLLVALRSPKVTMAPQLECAGPRKGDIRRDS